MQEPAVEGWSSRSRTALLLAFVGGIAIRLYFLPDPGYTGDIEQFVKWVNHIVLHGLGHAYDQQLSFGPVMAYLWGLQGALAPGFQTAVDATDPFLRTFMKVPGTLADFGLAGLAVYTLRSKPGWAIAAGTIVLYNPAIWFVSAWWGQYESIFTLALLIAFVLAAKDRDVLAAVALSVALMTKPQALPLLLPFAAWFLARGGLLSVFRATVAGAATAVVLWLPYIPANGPANYLASLAYFQDERFPFLSLRAWNFWWLVQDLLGHGRWIDDRTLVIGPLSARYLAYGIAGSLSLLIAWSIWRLRTTRALLLGVAATSLVTYTFLTTMHERYAYASVFFLILLIEDRRLLTVLVVLSGVFFANLVAAASAAHFFDTYVEVGGANGFVGSLVIVVLALLTLGLAVAPAVRGMRPGTSARSAVATSAA